jgi:hypothetical protein
MLKSRTKPAWGNGLSPFQGSGCFNVHYQGVALGWIIAAFQASHPAAAQTDGFRAAELADCLGKTWALLRSGLRPSL